MLTTCFIGTSTSRGQGGRGNANLKDASGKDAGIACPELAQGELKVKEGKGVQYTLEFP